jgi:hypothetical protein
MIHCHNCGTDNLDGSEFCDECGTKLAAIAPARTPNYMPPQVGPPPPPSFTRDPVTPKPATPYTPPPPARHPSAVSSANETHNQAGNQTVAYHQPSQMRGGSGVGGGGGPQPAGGGSAGSPAGSGAGNAPEVRAWLVIQRGGEIGKKFPIVGPESMIGRWDADGGIFPDVDLDQDDREAKVSRRHARILCYNNQYLIEDLGSTNGTFVNRGPRLLPGNRLQLNNGDEIIVGKTFLKFVVN